jgi:hypothetical protein
MTVMCMYQQTLWAFSTGGRVVPHNTLAERRFHWYLIAEFVGIFRDSKDRQNRGNHYEN